MPAEQAGIDGQLIANSSGGAQGENERQRGKEAIYQEATKDNKAGKNVIGGAIPFLEELIPGAVEFDARSDVWADALPLEMIDPRCRHMIDFPAG